MSKPFRKPPIYSPHQTGRSIPPNEVPSADDINRQLTFESMACHVKQMSPSKALRMAVHRNNAVTWRMGAGTVGCLITTIAQ